MIGPYATPQAFRTALEARLRNLAQSRGTDLQRLQRRVSFERLLARLFIQDDPPWFLKGGYALELRLKDQARSTVDVDISVPETVCIQFLNEMGRDVSCVEAVYAHLQEAAASDLGDGFEFLIGRLQEEHTGAPRGGARCSVEARMAGRTFTRFHLDVGLGDFVLDQPDWVEGSALLAFAGISPVQVALYPVAQQFAEKVHAYTFPWHDRDNTRVKDLIDLVLLVGTDLPDPGRIRCALRATFETRDTHPIPARLPEPPPSWAEPYAALARELELPASTLQEAYAYLDAWWDRWGLGQRGQSEFVEDV